MTFAVKNKFRASSKVSPLLLPSPQLPSRQQSTLSPDSPPPPSSSLIRESIVLHDDPDPLMLRNHDKKSNLLHTIKIYLHGSSSNKSSLLELVDNIECECCNSIAMNDNQQRTKCTQPEHNRQYQLLKGTATASQRREEFLLGSTANSIIRDSVNTSLSIFCSAPGGKPITELARESEPFLLDKSNGKTSARPPTPIESMTSPTATTINNEIPGVLVDDDDTILESLQDLNDTVVDLDSEFREVLHFNIGQSVRAPLPLNLLRHVTSLESSDEEEAAAIRAKDDSGPDDAEWSATDLCVSLEGKHLAANKRPSRRRRRLIPFHNLQDSTEISGRDGDDNDKARSSDTGGDGGDCENVRSPNEFQSLEEYYSDYSGSGLSTRQQEDPSAGGGVGDCVVMPAHGDLLFIDQGDETVFVVFV